MKLKYVVAIVGLLILLVAILMALADVEAPDLGLMVLDNAGEAVGIELKARAFSWSLRKGLVAEDVEASSSFPGGRLMMKVDQVVFEHELLPLLARKVVIRRFTMKRPRGQVVKTRSPSRRVTPKGGEGGGRSPETSPSKAPSAVDMVLWVSEFEIEDGTFTTEGHSSERKGISFEDLDIVFRDLSFQPGAVTLLHGLVARAELEAGSIDVGMTQLRGVRGRMDFDKGRIALPHVEYSASSGDYQARVTADLNQIPLGYTLNVEGIRLEIGALLGFLDNLTGTLTFQAKGFGTDSRSALGSGVLRLNGGVLAPFPILEAIDEGLGRRDLVNDSFEPFELDFEVNRGQWVLHPFELRTDSTSITVDGSAEIEGLLALNITVETSDGSGSSAFHVSGTVDNPIVEVVSKR